MYLPADLLTKLFPGICVVKLMGRMVCPGEPVPLPRWDKKCFLGDKGYRVYRWRENESQLSSFLCNSALLTVLVKSSPKSNFPGLFERLQAGLSS